MREKTDIVGLLQQGENVQIMTQGSSMFPMLVSGRDQVVIAPVEEAFLEGKQENRKRAKLIKRGEVLLYRREDGRLVLHRVWKQKGKEIYFVGDNQVEVEGPLMLTQIKGRMIGFYRKGKYYSVEHKVYQGYAKIWLLLRPFRGVFAGIYHLIKH